MTARAFLRALDPNAGAFAFQLIPEAGAGALRSFHGVPEGAIADHDRGPPYSLPSTRPTVTVGVKKISSA